MEDRGLFTQWYLAKMERMGIPQRNRCVDFFRLQCKQSSRLMRSLWAHINKTIPDETGRFARGQRHSQTTVLALISIARLNRVKGKQNVLEYGRSMTKARKKALGCWQDPKTGHYRLPSIRTMRRVARLVPAGRLTEAVRGWLLAP
jgi:hypothetical protein